MSCWFEVLRPCIAPRCRLFCFPYAGGGASVYRSWVPHIREDIELIGIQPAGRERRFVEAPFTDLHALIEAILPSFRGYMDRPFALFGYSVGALAAYELALRLQSSQLASPLRLFVAACNAPHRRDPNRVLLHNLPVSELIEELRKLGGMSTLALENAELMQLLMPPLRADLAMAETYQLRSAAKLSCAIDAFGGSEDDWTTRPQIEAWRDVTNGAFNCRMLDGGHFFIHTKLETVAAAVNRSLDASFRRDGVAVE